MAIFERICLKTPLNWIIAVGVMLYLLTSGSMAQNPPMRGDPFLPRGNPKSPNGKFEWIVKTNNPLRYALINLPGGETLATVKASYPESNSSDIRYAKAFGIFWNKDGTAVALDELNRRRAGHLYFFTIQNGAVREIPLENILPIPSYADEGRLVVDPGWESATKIRVRQALKTKSGDFVSKYFTIDFANPDAPEIQAE